MLNKNDYSDIAEKLREISEEASQKILEIYNSDFKINYKSDSSPLTLADTESNKIICEKLKKEFKKIPIISSVEISAAPMLTLIVNETNTKITENIIDLFENLKTFSINKLHFF